jgi:hypothetical protein
MRPFRAEHWPSRIVRHLGVIDLHDTGVGMFPQPSGDPHFKVAFCLAPEHYFFFVSHVSPSGNVAVGSARSNDTDFGVAACAGHRLAHSAIAVFLAATS